MVFRVSLLLFISYFHLFLPLNRVQSAVDYLEDKTCRIFCSFRFYKSDFLTYSDLDQNSGNVDLLEIWWTWSLIQTQERCRRTSVPNMVFETI